MASLTWVNFKTVFFVFKKFLQVKWTLYVAPWLLGFVPHIMFSILGVVKQSVDADIGGLCVALPYATTARAVWLFNFKNIFVTLFQKIIPLGISAVLYLAIGVELFRRRRRVASHLPVTNKTGGLHVLSKPYHGQMLQIFNAAKANKSERLNETRRQRSVKVLALASLLICCCVSPPLIVFSLTKMTPLIAALLDVWFFLSICVGPIVYVVTLSDMRAAWAKLLRKVC